MRSKSTRREILKGAVGAGVVAGLGSNILLANGRTDAPVQKDLIKKENEKPGTTEWQLTKSKVDSKTKYRCPWIEGYCSHTSIRAGETLKIMVSTNPASSFTIDIYRLGYYQGKGGRF